MARPRKTDSFSSDGSEERLNELLSDFSLDNAVRWLRKKFSSFDTSMQSRLPLGDSRNDQVYFSEIQRLGYVSKLKQDNKNDINKPLAVIAVRMKKDLSERTSRSVQFNCAKRLLKEEVEHGQHNLTGMPSQGIFFFYDDSGHFRISLVTGEVENRRFKFNEAKRQSFFVEPGAPNNIVRRRLNVILNSFADLKEAFSVEKLTKEFYDSLFKWYEWAMDPGVGVTFPNDTSRDDDDRKQLSEAMIRLITRLMFVWFILQKGIVPRDLFLKDKLMDIIRDFKPESMEQDNYYRVILQNLFFATLNCQPEKRKFVTFYRGMSKEQGVKTCYRYADELFSADDFKKMMKPVPFLNCALFDCLDKTERPQDGGRELLLDGFSSKPGKRAHVPNGLFFDEAKGLIKLFSLYEFTVDENVADDSDVALDPELLGKVFENLLGAFNPETQETARKATGSFYTPREIVDYMVEESLRNYLKSKVPSADDERLDDLFDKTRAIDGAPTKFTPDEINLLLNALYECKILDPACGSGAFPMGVLHCMVRLFSRLDPLNVRQREIILQRHREESAETCCTMTDAEKKDRDINLQKQLEEERLYPDYARKLYLIENCIYGVDIQPIATQISKLRFFISLLCDQLRSSWDPDADNYGLLSLPNLEAKFVCANTLLSLPKVDGGELALSADGIQELKEDLQKNRHKIFFARTAERKARYKEKDLELRDQIRETIRGKLYTPDEKIIAIYEKEIETALKEREAVAEPKIELEERIVGGDLFTEGEKQWVEVDVNARARKKIDDRIKNARRIIAEERNKTNLKPTGSTSIEKLAVMVAGWDPYDQNASSDFFDPEWMFNVKNGFDIVIGNPPYKQVAKGVFSPEIFRYSEAKDQGKQNLYKVFVEASFNFAKKQSGECCLIVQSSLLGDMSAKYTRQLLLQESSINKIIEFPKNAPTAEGKIFKSVLQGTCIASFLHVLPSDSHSFALSINNDRFTIGNLKFERILQKSIIPLFPDYYEIPLINQGEFTVVAKVKSSPKRVCDYLTDEAQGNINTIHLSKIQSNKRTDAWIAKGAHIHRWYIGDDLYYCVENRETQKLFAQNERKSIILTQNISGTTDKYRINATPFACKNTKIIFLDTTNVLYLSTPDEMYFVTAVLNAKITDWIFRKTSTNNHLNMYELKAIPVPRCSKEEKAEIVELVKDILTQKENNKDGDVSSLEQAIDLKLYHLYGLSDSEISVVLQSPDAPTNDALGTSLRSVKEKNKKTQRSSRREDEYLD